MKKLIIYVLALLFIYSCAKQMSPSGGPKDLKPPVVLEMEPAIGTTNFSEKKIKIYFDEFIKLKELQEQLIISPPLEGKPQFVVKGKKLVMKLPDSLPPNRTIGFNFYNAVVDVNEENILKDFRYYFSTGHQLDTSFIDGKVLDAFTGKPVEKARILIYNKFEDSLVSKQKPYAIAKTNADGIFVVHNLSTGPYRLFALTDNNRNEIYDLPNEGIAFCTDSIKPEIKWTTVHDTIKLIDTINAQTNDTIYRDSISSIPALVSALKPFELSLFVKDYKKFFLQSNERSRKTLINIGFSREVTEDQYKINVVSDSATYTNWAFEQKIGNDSLLLWITDPKVYNSDSIQLEISYPFTDSINEVITKTDSIYFIYEMDKLKKRDTSLTIATNLRGKKLDLDSLFTTKFSTPIEKIDTGKIDMFIKKDTVYEPITYNIKLFSYQQRLEVTFEKDLLAHYRIVFDSAAFTDIYGYVNDSTNVDFVYAQPEDYGNYIINLDTVSNDFIIEILKEDGGLYARKEDIERNTIQFYRLLPGDYEIKILIDRNRNGKWDTGDYYKGIQPEQVIAHSQKVKIKANWDTELNWKIKKQIKQLK